FSSMAMCRRRPRRNSAYGPGSIGSAAVACVRSPSKRAWSAESQPAIGPEACEGRIQVERLRIGGPSLGPLVVDTAGHPDQVGTRSPGTTAREAARLAHGAVAERAVPRILSSRRAPRLGRDRALAPLLGGDHGHVLVHAARPRADAGLP